MENIVVKNPSDKTLASQLLSLTDCLVNLGLASPASFDLSNLTSAGPLLLTPLAAYITKATSQYTVDEKTDIKNYLKIIHFPEGARSQEDLKAVRDASLPITILQQDNQTQRDALEKNFLQMISRTLDAVPGAKNALYYPALELINNVFDHSQAAEAWIFAEQYENDGYVDICIADTGRGFSKTYKEEKGLMLSDEQALAEALKGNSTKPALERGYGLRTSKNVVCKALGGGFIIISGKAILIATKERDTVYQIPGFSWQGVVIAYRIPHPKEPVDITPYLE